MDQLAEKMLWPEAHRSLTLCFPRNKGSVFTDAMFAGTSQNPAMMDKLHKITCACIGIFPFLSITRIVLSHLETLRKLACLS